MPNNVQADKMPNNDYADKMPNKVKPDKMPNKETNFRYAYMTCYVGLSVKISSCKHLQKIFENWLVMRKSISRQQSLSFIDYIYLNKSKSYAGHMQAKLKQRKIILENFAALIVFSPQAKRDNQSKSATEQRLKLKYSIAFAHIISRNILIRVLFKQRVSKV